jgi:hypothetical protein
MGHTTAGPLRNLGTGPMPDARSALHAAVRDAAYTTVGFAVLGLQRVQVQRRELERWLRQVRDEVTRCGSPSSTAE